MYQGEVLPFVITILWLLFQNQASAAPQNIAILDFMMTPEDTTVRTLVEDEIRASIFKFTQPDKIDVMTKEETRLILEKNAKPFRCLNFSCMNDLARSIGTEFVIFGSIEQRNDQWELDIRLFERKKNIVVSAVKNTEPDVMTLVQNLDGDVAVLTQNLPSALPPKEDKVKLNDPTVKTPPKIDKEPEKMRFHFLSLQCSKNKTGLNFFGYCHSGVFFGPVHLGGIVYSQVEEGFIGALQTSIYNESKNFFGALQLGIVNNTKINHTGVQFGLVNISKQLFGGQMGIVNNTNNFLGFQLGLVNTTNHAYGFQGGLINTAKKVHGVQAGLINTTGHLYGVQLGFLNFSKNNAAPATVGLNIGW